MRKFLAVLIAGLGIVTAGSAIAADAPDGEYYSQSNIWYERPDQVFTTNFHRGSIIPVNTKFTVSRITGSEIVLTPVESGMVTITIVNVPRHTKISLREHFDRYFKKQPVDLAKFTKDERAAIKDGDLTIGLSKPAVLAAFGYPPSHMTDLAADQWTFWRARASRTVVYFDKDDKVVQIVG